MQPRGWNSSTGGRWVNARHASAVWLAIHRVGPAGFRQGPEDPRAMQLCKVCSYGTGYSTCRCVYCSSADRCARGVTARCPRATGTVRAAVSTSSLPVLMQLSARARRLLRLRIGRPVRRCTVVLCSARRRCFNVDGTAAGWTPRGGMCVASASTTQQRCGAKLKEDAEEDVAGKLT